MVGLSQHVHPEHEYDDATGDVALIFQGRDELVLNCTRSGLDALTQLVQAARRTIETADTCDRGTAPE